MAISKRTRNIIIGIVLGCVVVTVIVVLVVVNGDNGGDGDDNDDNGDGDGDDDGDGEDTTLPSGVRGICYDTGKIAHDVRHDPVKLRSCIASDLRTIRSHGYNAIRTYFPIFGYVPCDETETRSSGYYTKLIAELNAEPDSPFNMSVMIGVQTDQYDTYRDCIIDQVNLYPGTVHSVCIGNENVQDDNWDVAAATIATATDLRSEIGENIRIGTVQQNGFLMCAFANEYCSANCPQTCQDAYTSMLESLDFIGGNVYPGTQANNGSIASSDPAWNKQSFTEKADQTLAAMSNTSYIITECGMPHAGECHGETFSRSLQTQLLTDIENWRLANDVDVFVFMAFDVPSKPNICNCTGEKTFGVLPPPDGECTKIEDD
jgi:exo-beta-1,3-glucanase (GH17 family)